MISRLKTEQCSFYRKIYAHFPAAALLNQNIAETFGWDWNHKGNAFLQDDCSLYLA